MRGLLLVLAAGCAYRSPLPCPSPLHPPAMSGVTPLLVADTNQIYLYGGAQLWRRSFGACGGWQNLTPPSTPTLGTIYAAAFDDKRHRIIYVAGDVWSLDTNALTFTKLLTVGAPPLGNSGVAAYDAMHDRLVFVGTFTYSLDFSVSDQGAWTELGASPVLAPATGAIDPTRATLLALDGAGLHAFAFPTSGWHDVAVTGALPAGARLTWDATRRRMLAVGNGTFVAQLDALATSGSFAQLATTNDPPARTGFGALADGDFVWLYGGTTSCALDDEWQLDLGRNAWTNLHPATSCN